MKLKIIISVLLVITTLFLGFLFFNNPNGDKRMDYTSSLLMDLPPLYHALQEFNNPAFKPEIAQRFLSGIKNNPNEKKFALKIAYSQIIKIYLLDLNEQSLRERTVSVTGTIVQNLWRGSIEQRLIYAVENNSFVAPGTSEAESKNLYH